MIYLDTSALLKLYLLEDGSVETQHWIASQSHPLPVWEIQHMEFLNAMRLKVFWKEITAADAETQIALFKDRKRRGLYFFPDIGRSDLMRTFERLSAKTMDTGCRTMDILHVACALQMPIKQFVTFDDRQKKLAKSEGLPVPDLEPT